MAVFVSAAVGAAIADFTIVTALTAISAVGAATSAVGLVTGDKNLMKIGGVMGLVGGLGGLAAGAMGLGAEAAAGAGAAAGDVANAASFDAANFPGMATDAASAGATVGADAASGAIDAASSGANTFPVGGAGSMPGSDMTMPGGGVTPIGGAMPTDPVTGLPANAPSINPVTGLPNTPGVQQLDPQTGGAISSPMQNGVSPDAAFPDGIAGAPVTAPAPTQVTDGTNYSNEGGNYPSSGSASNSPINAPQPSMMDTIIGKLGDTWHKLPPLAQAEVAKSILAIPGGIQANKLKEREMGMQQQKINQTSYGSQVPRYGILNRAKG